MDDDAVCTDLRDIELLLPPRATEYRSGSVPGVLGPAGPRYEEPATVPNLHAVPTASAASAVPVD
jgi:hypothetical protein